MGLVAWPAVMLWLLVLGVGALGAVVALGALARLHREVAACVEAGSDPDQLEQTLRDLDAHTASLHARLGGRPVPAPERR